MLRCTDYSVVIYKFFVCIGLWHFKSSDYSVVIRKAKSDNEMWPIGFFLPEGGVCARSDVLSRSGRGHIEPRITGTTGLRTDAGTGRRHVRSSLVERALKWALPAEGGGIPRPVFSGWMTGFEPAIPRSTIWCLNR
jgi:hypothetical protein